MLTFYQKMHNKIGIEFPFLSQRTAGLNITMRSVISSFLHTDTQTQISLLLTSPGLAVAPSCRLFHIFTVTSRLLNSNSFSFSSSFRWWLCPFLLWLSYYDVGEDGQECALKLQKNLLRRNLDLLGRRLGGNSEGEIMIVMIIIIFIIIIIIIYHYYYSYADHWWQFRLLWRDNNEGEIMTTIRDRP